MSYNEFNQTFSLDFAPEGSLCEWCGKPAVQQLTMIGGKSHNKGGFFCHQCGEKFIGVIVGPESKAAMPEASAERDALTS